jgi:hypothetical protein
MADLHLVTAPPPLSLKGVFESSHWRHVLMLTYSFDLPFFESYLLPHLIRNGARAITVAADARWLAARLPGWIEAGEVREAGKSYTLSGVYVPGSFHPKVTLGVSETTGAVLIGSGNISRFGLATIGELFTYVEWDDGRIPSLAQQAWRICRDIARTLTLDPLFGERVEALGAFSSALSLALLDADLLHNLTEPLLDQLIRQVRGRSVRQVMLWAPFSDHRLEALTTIIERLRPRQVTLAVQPGRTSIDGERLGALMQAQPGIEWQVVELTHQETTKQPGRHLIHAKGILVTLESGEEMLLAGSPNLSTPALLRTAVEANCEVARLVRGSHIQRDLFSADGPISIGGVVDPARITWSGAENTASLITAPTPITLLGARFDGAAIRLTVRGECPASARALIDNEYTAPLARVQDMLQVAVLPETVPTSISIVWEGGQSGPVIIAHMSRLLNMVRGGEASQRTPLEAIDYGGDDDLIKILDELAKLAILTSHDVDRLLRGRSAPSEQDEAAEAGGQAPPVDLADLNFDDVRQHPRALAYMRGVDGAFDAPRLQLWLDDIVRQFDSLREQQALRVITPLFDEASDDEPSERPVPDERRRWTVSRRVRLRIWNRVRRYILGVSDPRFWRLIHPEWMAQNYALFLDFLNRLWNRTADPQTQILSPDDLAKLSHDLLEAFWGSDAQSGYWAALTEDEAMQVAFFLIEYQSDALTMAMASRLLAVQGEIRKTAPFIAAGIVRVMDSLGLLTEEAAERALVYLDRPEQYPAALLQQIRSTLLHFTWERYRTVLAKRYELRRVSIEDRGFTGGDTLVVGAIEPLDKHPRPLAIFADWIRTTLEREPTRYIFQMIWNSDEAVIIYHAGEKALLRRFKDAAGKFTTQTLSEGTEPTAFSTWEGLSARADGRLQLAS